MRHFEYYEIELRILFRDYTKVVSAVDERISPRQQVYFAVANLAGNYLESRQYHLYRGVLNPLGPGGDLLRLFDVSVDRLLQSDAIDDADAKVQKATIREGIKNVG